MSDDPLVHQCCFCARTIDPSDVAAVMITFSSLWGRTEAAQSIFGHSTCAAEKLANALSPAMPFDVEMFGG